jgi:hypothetical protein
MKPLLARLLLSWFKAWTALYIARCESDERDARASAEMADKISRAVQLLVEELAKERAGDEAAIAAEDRRADQARDLAADLADELGRRRRAAEHPAREILCKG